MSLYLVGLGPGGGSDLTVRAKNVLEKCTVFAGYTVYLELIRADYPDKEYICTPMKREEERCRMALKAAQDADVAMVCSGDPGVYGMASLCYELAADYPPVDIEVVPGVTAATGGAAVLGAPLTHDFAVLSLSDLMTPMELIERRLEAAAWADLVVCIYNPSSHKRADYLARACEILLRHKRPDTPCGYVRNIGRAGETAVILTLEALKDAKVDMFTTVFVGNAQTKVLNGELVTPRGYLQR